MKARLNNPAMIIPEAMEAIKMFAGVSYKGGVDPKLLALIHLRVSQINGCGFCVDTGWRHATKAGETHERLYTVAAFRDTPYFSEAERAALALAEHATRLADQTDAVPDAVWNEAAKHFSERQLAGILLHIAVTNVFNRLNVPIRQPAAGEWKG